ncbi:MAG: hypothetical protein QXP40_05805 [Desulfurococcaceae archaeon]
MKLIESIYRNMRMYLKRHPGLKQFLRGLEGFLLILLSPFATAIMSYISNFVPYNDTKLALHFIGVSITFITTYSGVKVIENI